MLLVLAGSMIGCSAPSGNALDLGDNSVEYSINVESDQRMVFGGAFARVRAAESFVTLTGARAVDAEGMEMVDAYSVSLKGHDPVGIAREIDRPAHTRDLAGTVLDEKTGIVNLVFVFRPTVEEGRMTTAVELEYTENGGEKKRQRVGVRFSGVVVDDVPPDSPPSS